MNGSKGDAVRSLDQAEHAAGAPPSWPVSKAPHHLGFPRLALSLMGAMDNVRRQPVALEELHEQSHRLLLSLSHRVVGAVQGRSGCRLWSSAMAARTGT